MIMADKARMVIIGAGATGRGHIGQIAHDAGFGITFIERTRDLVDTLKQAGTYKVGLAGETIQYLEISGFAVLHIDETHACSAAIAEADIVATAVLPTNLESTIPTLSAGLALRRELGVEKPLNVIACENMERSSSTLRSYLRSGAPDLDWSWIDAHVGFPDSMVARAVPVPKLDPLVLLAESTQEWSVDAKGLREPMPRVKGMTLSQDQEAALERKLYIKNTGHMAIGVLGYLAGYRLMDEAARDPRVLDLVDAATRESAAAVIAKHSFDPEWTEHYRASFLEAMKSPFLPDEIERVIREPMRKLTREERLVGPAMLASELGLPYGALAEVIAACLMIDNASDPQSQELQSMISSRGVETTLCDLCGIPGRHPLAGLVIDALHGRGKRLNC
jgi:mannitol-1-phosphate 5-dehydrogenase